MNKNEFYKELMKKYTFDADKVLSEAKRASVTPSLNRRGFIGGLVGKHASLGAVAAMLALALCAYSFRALWTTSPPVTDLTPVVAEAGDRLRNARDALGKSRESFETKGIYLSLGDAIDYNRLKTMLDDVSDTGNIKIEALYINGADGGIVCVTDPAGINSIRLSGECDIIAVKINAPENLLEDLTKQDDVIAAEPENDILNTDNFTPLKDTDIDEPLIYPGVFDNPNLPDREPSPPRVDLTSPINTDNPVISAVPDLTAGNDTPEDPIDPYTPQDDLTPDDSDNPNIPATTEDPDYPDDPEGFSEDGDDDDNDSPPEQYPDDTEGSESDEPQDEQVNEPDIIVPEKIIEANIPDLYEIKFINDDTFIALTEYSVSLYKIDEEYNFALTASYGARNCKLRLSSGGESFIISGCLDSGRTLLFVADAQAGTLTQINTASMTEDAVIIYAFYDDINGRIVARTQGDGYNSIYMLDEMGGAVCLTRYAEDTSILALKGNYLYYSFVAESGKEIRKLNILNDAEEIIATLESGSGFERSADLSNFTISSDDGKISQVYITDSDKLTAPIGSASALKFSPNSSRILTDGINYYAVDANGELVTVSYETVAGYFSENGASYKFTIDGYAPDTVRLRIKS